MPGDVGLSLSQPKMWFGIFGTSYAQAKAAGLESSTAELNEKLASANAALDQQKAAQAAENAAHQ